MFHLRSVSGADFQFAKFAGTKEREFGPYTDEKDALKSAHIFLDDLISAVFFS